MPCQILVANQCNKPRAELIVVVDGDHQWSKNECMQSFLAGGGKFEDWSRQYSLVIVTDRDAEDLEYLMDDNEEGLSKYFFIEPDSSTDVWQELFSTGQYIADWETISSMMEER